MLIAQTIDPRKHTVLQSCPPFLRFLRREYPDYEDSLFLLRFRNGVFVICGWVNKTAGRFVELLGLGPSLNFTRAQRLRFDEIMDPPTESLYDGRRLSKALASRDRGIDNQAAGELGEFLDHKRFLFKKLDRAGQANSPYWNEVRQ